MGLFDFLKSKKDKEVEDPKKRMSVDGRSLQSDNFGYRNESIKHAKVHNKLLDAEDKLHDLKMVQDAPFSSNSKIMTESEIKNYNKNQANKYASKMKIQVGVQMTIKGYLFQLMNHRAIMANVIKKFNNKWPDREVEVIEMMAETREHYKNNPDEMKEIYSHLSRGTQPDDRFDLDKGSTYYDMGKEEHEKEYDEFMRKSLYNPFKSRKK